MVGKRLVNTGGAAGAAAFDPLQNFETVTYTGNGGTQKITGYIRKGAAFNGSSSYIDTSVSVLPADNYTVSMWVYHNSLKNSCALYTQYRGTVTGRHIVNSNANGGIQINTSSTNSLSSITATPFTTNTWQHLVVTKSSTSGYVVYIDGSSIGSWSNTDNIITDQSTQFGGDTEWSGDHWLNGKIDQVRIFDKALDQDDVDDLYLETYDSSTKSTTDIFGDGSGVALYELDEDANDTGVAIDAGQSASFTNTNQNYIQLPSGIDTILNTKNFGLSLWVKAPNAATDAVFSTETTNSTFQIHANWGFAGAYALINGGGSDINLGAVDSNWHHIVVTSDGSSSYKGYFDKVYKGASTYRQTSNVGTFLGSHPSGGFNLEGQIDQVRIFNRQLSQSDIDSLYNETSPSTVDYFGDGNGKALYKLDNTPDDESGSYNATWNGTAAYIDEAANVKYDGTPANINFLGMAFQPDLVWIKNRFDVNNLPIFDSTRGREMLTTSTPNQGFTPPSGYDFTSFDSNGFTVAGSPYYININDLNDSMVAWCFKGGGNSNTYNVDDTGYSTASAAGLSSANGTTLNGASVNTQAGFSIINYETNINGDNRPAHGLTQEPELIIFKPYDTSSLNWYVMTKKIDGSLDFLFLNTTDTKIDAGTNEFIDSTHFRTSFGTVWGSIIAYCFHSVEGYQKVGGYTGLGGTSGPLVDLGFEPRWIMIKGADTTGASNWFIWDYQRDIPNPNNSPLQPNSNAAELTDNTFVQVTFGATNFQVSSSAASPQINELNKKYIYLAIA